jgi:hypothetical protein
MNKLFNSSPRILVSNTAWHGHFKTSYPIAELIKLMEPEFRKILNYHQDTTFSVTAIRKRSKSGQYWSNQRMVELDCRLPLSVAITTLAHELVHAEQYHQGRLITQVSNGRWVRYWNNKPVEVRNGYKAYRALPWEVEAFDRESSLAEQALGQIGLTVDDLNGVLILS